MIDDVVTPPSPLGPTLLAEYDQLIAALHTQQKLYSTEHAELKTEILELLTHNQELSSIIEELFKNRLQPQELASVVNSEMIENLRRQLELSQQERSQLCDMLSDARDQLRQNSGIVQTRGIRSIDAAVGAKMETLQLELRMEKSARESDENQLLRLQTDLAKMRMLLDSKEDDERELKMRLAEFDKQCSNCEQENIVLRATLNCIQESRDALEVSLAEADKKIAAAKVSSNEARRKVEEAVEVAEKAVVERDTVACREENLLKKMHQLERAYQADLELKIQTAKADWDAKVSSVKELLSVKEREWENMRELCSDLENALATANAENVVIEEIRKALKEVLQENEELMINLDVAQKRQNEITYLAESLEGKLSACVCSQLRNKLHKVKSDCKAQVGELQRMLDEQLLINQLWQVESEKLISQLQSKAEKSVKKIEKLKLRNKQLTIKLKGG